MANNRTNPKWTRLIMHDSGATLRNVPISSVNGLGLEYDFLELLAFQDAIKSGTPGHPANTLEFTHPFDVRAAAASPALSGSHTVLSPLLGAVTPLTLDVQVGMGATWTNGDPQFGMTADADDGYVCVFYMNNGDGTSTSRFEIVGGGTLPAWGTAAET